MEEIRANLNGAVMQHVLIHLPPVEEQRRIVAAVHVLFDICNQLKASIAAARTKHALQDDVLVGAAGALIVR